MLLNSRYRKINLYDEKLYQTGDENQKSTFKTDFGVTFGMFICFDIAFRQPAINVLTDPEVTDVVYSTAWLSILPFFGGNLLSIIFVQTLYMIFFSFKYSAWICNVQRS